MTIINQLVRSRLRKINSILFVITLCSVSYSFSITTSVSGDLIYDTNIPQNITEYAGFYGIPKMHFSIENFEGFKPFSAWCSINYSNYLKQRSPTLGKSFLFTGAALTFRPAFVVMKTKYSFSLYLYPTWETARTRHRLDQYIKFSFGSHHLIPRINLDVDDYGNNRYDGIDIDVSLEYRYRFRTLKRQNVTIRSASLQVEMLNDLADDTVVSYTEFSVSAKTELKFWQMTLDLTAEPALRKFKAKVPHPQRNTLLKAENKYIRVAWNLDIPIWRGFSANTNAKLQLKDSNNPTYDYNRHTFAIGLTWKNKFPFGD